MLLPLRIQGYELESDRERGLGRPDIILHPPVGKPAVVIELGTHYVNYLGPNATDEEKRKEQERIQKLKDSVTSDEDLQPHADIKLKQIMQNEYIRGLKAKSVILCSIFFVRKYVAVSMKEQKL